MNTIGNNQISRVPCPVFAALEFLQLTIWPATAYQYITGTIILTMQANWPGIFIKLAAKELLSARASGARLRGIILIVLVQKYKRHSFSLEAYYPIDWFYLIEILSYGLTLIHSDSVDSAYQSNTIIRTKIIAEHGASERCQKCSYRVPRRRSVRLIFNQ